MQTGARLQTVSWPSYKRNGMLRQALGGGRGYGRTWDSCAVHVEKTVQISTTKQVFDVGCNKGRSCHVE